MRIRVDDLVARCKRCGSVEFRRLSDEPLRPQSALACEGCEQRTTYRELLDGIGEEAMRLARESIARMKKTKMRPRRPRK